MQGHVKNLVLRVRIEINKKKEVSGMKVVIRGEAKEIAALVLEIQGRQYVEPAEQITSQIAEQLLRTLHAAAGDRQ